MSKELQDALTAYKYRKIGSTTFSISLHGDDVITVEHTNEEQVKKQVGLLNGAFKEGIIFAASNRIELDQLLKM